MKHKSEDYKISAVRFYLSNSSFTVDAINRQALHFQWSACLFIAISISLTSIPSGGKGYLYNTPRQRSPTCRGIVVQVNCSLFNPSTTKNHKHSFPVSRKRIKNSLDTFLGLYWSC